MYVTLDPLYGILMADYSTTISPQALRSAVVYVISRASDQFKDDAGLAQPRPLAMKERQIENS